MRDPLADLPHDVLFAMMEALALAVTADRVVEEMELKHYDALLEEILPDPTKAHELSKEVFDDVATLPVADYPERIDALCGRIPEKLRQELYRRVVRISAADGRIVPIEDEVMSRFAQALAIDEDTAAYLRESELPG